MKERSLFRAFLLTLLSVLLTSCSCNWHLKKAADKCPNLRIQDTLVIRDTIRLSEVSHDTTFYAQPGDTVFVTKDRLKYRYINLGEGRHNIAAKCDTVLVNRFIKVPYTKTIYKPDWLAEIRRFWWVILILLGLVTLRKILA